MSIDLGNLLQSQLGGVLGQFLTNSGEAEESSGKAAGLGDSRHCGRLGETRQRQPHECLRPV